MTFYTLDDYIATLVNARLSPTQKLAEALTCAGPDDANDQ